MACRLNACAMACRFCTVMLPSPFFARWMVPKPTCEALDSFCKVFRFGLAYIQADRLRAMIWVMSICGFYM